MTKTALPDDHLASRQWLWRVAAFLWVGVLVFALYALQKQWANFRVEDLTEAVGRIGWKRMLLALGCTVLSYGFNASVDLFAVRWLGKTLPRARTLMTSFIAASFSMNAGGTILGGGAVRMRFYTSYGFSPGEVARMTGFAMAISWCGHGLLAGALLVLAPGSLPWLSPALTGALGGALLLGCGLVAWAGSQRWIIRRFPKWALIWPPLRIAVPAILVSAMDWLMAGLAIRVLLPEELGVSTVAVLGAVILAQWISALSHVPGGIGVLELSISKMLAASIPVAMLASVLLSYRILYYLIPFALAAGIMGAHEVWQKRHIAQVGWTRAARVWTALAPRLATLLALAGGFVLLVSANTPIGASRRDFLENIVPLPFIEASNFFTSIIGVLLLVVARGLQRRVHGAWIAAVGLSAAGIVFSLTKGGDYEEALVLAIFLACLLPFRNYFHRHTAFWARRFTADWWGLLLALIIVAVWLGFFTYRHVGYENQLWWQFSIDGDASRFLRSLVAIAVILLLVILAQWFRPSKPRVKEVEPDPDWDLIARLVSETSQSHACLALLGDKQFLFNEKKDAFLMYGEQGRSRIIMGDPVGDEEASETLLWRFLESAEDEGFRPCVYQLSAETMPRYVDMGMHLYKLGEEAFVNLDTFSMEGSHARKLRQAKSRMERNGWSFAIWPVEKVKQEMARLKAVSDHWLLQHNAREKGFSLGRFDEPYMKRFPVAVVVNGEELGAFANLWCGGGKEELSVDLMRYTDAIPGGAMDYLFSELFMWGKSQGYHRFNMGMAPLSGLTAHPLAPLWNRLGSLVFESGESFYNFQGLRDYKEKYQPEWEPRYLAVPSAWQLPAALVDITALIGGGWRRTFLGKGRGKVETSA